MEKKKIVLISVFVLILVVAGAIAFYYWREDTLYVSTQDARIAANIVTVTPQIAGKITTWKVNEGNIVQAGDNLGWQDTNTVATSAGVNTNAFAQIGSVTVSKAEIVAPISGQVIKSTIEPGQMVGPGQALAMIADIDDLYVAANIEETVIDKVKVGEDVEITIDALQNKKVMGKVSEIGKATSSTFSILPVQSSNGTFTKVVQNVPVKIRFSGSSQFNLVPGMSVEIKIHVTGN